MFKLQSPSKYSPFNAVPLLTRFFPLIETVSTLLILMSFNPASTVFCFTSSTSAKCLTLRTYFILGNKSCLWLDWWIGRMGHGGHASFGQKLPKSEVWAGVLLNHPPWHWQTCCFKKHSLKLNAACHSNATWHTDIDGFLGPSPSRGNLLL